MDWVAGGGVPRRTSTPYVHCVQRTKNGETFWLGRWQDPITERRREVVLDRLGIKNEQQRKAWRQAKAAEIDVARAAKNTGKVAATMKTADAVAAYLADCEGRNLRPATRYCYRKAAESLRDWLVREGRLLIQEVTPADLMAYRAQLVRMPGDAETKSNHLRHVGTALEWLRTHHLTPMLSGDAIRDARKALQKSRPRPRCLRSAELLTLARAAVKQAAREPKAAAFFVTILLTGARLAEIEGLHRAELELDAPPHGEINLTERTKTHKARTIDLSACPIVREILRALPDEGPYVFGGSKPLHRDVTKRWKRELQALPSRWTWKQLRSTCGTWLVCAPGIFGGASVYMASRQLGHSTRVAETHYWNVLRGIDPQARTLERAMAIESEVGLIATYLKANGGDMTRSE
jgi:integrase